MPSTADGSDLASDLTIQRLGWAGVVTVLRELVFLQPGEALDLAAVRRQS